VSRADLRCCDWNAPCMICGGAHESGHVHVSGEPTVEHPFGVVGSVCSRHTLREVAMAQILMTLEADA
jgi:hypothetical protein